MKSRTRTPILAVLLAAVSLPACAGTRRPPEPVEAPPAPKTAAAPDTAAPEPGVALEPVEPGPPPLPWLPLGVEWEPGTPREGQAIGIHLLQPAAGRHPVAVEGRLGEWPVHFAHLGKGWFGVAPAPIGSAGAKTLVLRYRLAPDSVVVDSLPLPVASYTFPFTRLSVAPRFANPPPEALEKIRRDREEIHAVIDSATPEWMPRHPFEWPRKGRITSPFGQRRIFNGELKSRHTGVDISGRRGEPVRSAARGRVALIGHFYYTGNTVFVDHGLGVYTSYDHLSRVDVHEGQVVERGELIGEVGATGRVTGPHLHWGLHVDGIPLDARSLFDLRFPVSSSGGAAAGG